MRLDHARAALRLPRKGAVDGPRRDLVLPDPAARRTITADTLHHTSDFTPYEGMVVTGRWRRAVARRGCGGRGRFTVAAAALGLGGTDRWRVSGD
jgi:hypothetical protein